MILLSVLGLLLILLLGLDVFLTVFHPQGRGGPVNRRVSSLIWSAARASGRRGDGSTRDRLLAMGGPVIVTATLLVWVLLLVGGFALIFYPWVETFLVSPGTLRSPWAEALYYSAYTAATLGLGDVVANSEALRLITALEAFGGFMLLSASITYFLAVYRELIAMQSLAADISGLFRAGEVHVVEFTKTEGYEALARWSEQLANSLSKVLLAHFQYPVLHYFRPKERSRALPVQLGALLRLRTLVDADEGSTVVAAFTRHPSYLALTSGVESYLTDVDRLFIPADIQGTRSDRDDETDRSHARLLDYMLYM